MHVRFVSEISILFAVSFDLIYTTYKIPNTFKILFFENRIIFALPNKTLIEV